MFAALRTVTATNDSLRGKGMAFNLQQYRTATFAVVAYAVYSKPIQCTFKYHVFAPMGRFQLELIYLYFPPSFHLTVGCFCPVGLSLL